MNKFFCLALCLLGQAASAHDFWLQPAAFWSAVGARIPITLQVGHGPSRQQSAIPLRRIVRAEVDGKAADIVANGIEPRRAGTYLVGMETDNRAQSHLPAQRFNEYLIAEGLTDALDYRERHGQMAREGSETYSRRTKAILQAGPVASDVSRPLGMTLEIIPLVNPYAQPAPAQFPVTVLYEGAPLAGALVRLTNLDSDAEPFESRLTDRDGRASFSMPARGQWMFNVVWTKPLPEGSKTDFDTVFSSLSFGFTGKP